MGGLTPHGNVLLRLTPPKSSINKNGAAYAPWECTGAPYSPQIIHKKQWGGLRSMGMYWCALLPMGAHILVRLTPHRNGAPYAPWECNGADIHVFTAVHTTPPMGNKKEQQPTNGPCGLRKYDGSMTEGMTETHPHSPWISRWLVGQVDTLISFYRYTCLHRGAHYSPISALPPGKQHSRPQIALWPLEGMTEVRSVLTNRHLIWHVPNHP